MLKILKYININFFFGRVFNNTKFHYGEVFLCLTRTLEIENRKKFNFINSVSISGNFTMIKLLGYCVQNFPTLIKLVGKVSLV